MSDDNIRILKTLATAANNEAEQQLIQWLELVREGKVIAVAIAGLAPDGSAVSSHTQVPSNAMSLIGAIEVMRYKLVAEIAQQEE